MNLHTDKTPSESLEVRELNRRRPRTGRRRGTKVAEMDVAKYLSTCSFWSPEHLTHPLSWVGHIPFAFWIMEATSPGVMVELGTHSGNSYFSFCQAVKRLNLRTLCHAVDSWHGDEHSGYYGEEIFQAVSETNRLEYDSFSRLIRSRFDEARGQFDDASIDLLHIDGFHTYEAVKHDFENWLPKMSKRGIILLHDTNVHVKDFGVRWLFQEKALHFPAFEFTHCHGLGALGVGVEIPRAVRSLFEASGDESSCNEVRACYERLGQAVLEQAALADCQALSVSLSGEFALAQEALSAAQRHIDILEQQRSDLGAEVRRSEDERKKLHDVVVAQQNEIVKFQHSLGWILLNRARLVRNRLIRDDGKSGRCWTALKRYLKSEGASGSNPRLPGNVPNSGEIL